MPPWRKHRFKNEIALHAFKRGFTFQHRHLSQEGRNQPSMCVLVFHDLCHVPRPRFIKGSLDVHAGQVHCGSHYRASTWEFCPLAIPNVFVRDLLPSLAGVDNLIHSSFPRAVSSNFLVPFLLQTKNSTRCVTVLKLLILFFGSASGFLKKISCTIFHELGASI